MMKAYLEDALGGHQYRQGMHQFLSAAIPGPEPSRTIPAFKFYMLFIVLQGAICLVWYDGNEYKIITMPTQI